MKDPKLSETFSNMNSHLVKPFGNLAKIVQKLIVSPSLLSAEINKNCASFHLKVLNVNFGTFGIFKGYQLLQLN